MTFFLFLSEDFDFRQRRDVCIRNSNHPLENFTCRLFFRILLNLSPIIELVFDVLHKIKIPKKVRGVWWLIMGCVCNVK